MESGGFLKSSVLTLEEINKENLSKMGKPQYSEILEKCGFRTPREVNNDYRYIILTNYLMLLQCVEESVKIKERILIP